MSDNDPNPETTLSIQESMQLAARHIASGWTDQAAKVCQQALTRFPDNADLYYVLAITLSKGDRLDEAIDAYKQAILHKPDFFQAYSNLGSLLTKRRRSEEALAAFEKAVQLRPDSAEVQINWSTALREHWRYDEAIAAVHKAIALQPDSADALNALGAAQLGLGRFDEAIANCRAAIQRKPQMAEAHLNLGFAELLRGNFQTGWEEYEWRQRVLSINLLRQFTQPRWDGHRLKGKTIFLYAEQGYGDAIHFIRYAPMVAGLGGRVVFECPLALLRLFSGLRSIDHLVASGQPLPSFDYQCSLLSLPSVFKTTLASIPASVPYLKADPEAAESWRKRIAAGNELQVGLVWLGHPDHKNDRNRSIGLEKLSPLANVKGVRFHSVQLAKPPANSPMPLTDWSADLSDFAETAALLTNLDLVISVDTSVAHLAGAMGKTIWIFLPFMPDWRWMLNRPDTPWYPTARLFRQESPGDWHRPIQSVARCLADAVAARRPRKD